MMQVTCPIPGTYLVHQPGQRPVEGTGVYLYKSGVWVCEVDGTTYRTTRQDCKHIGLAKQFVKEEGAA